MGIFHPGAICLILTENLNKSCPLKGSQIYTGSVKTQPPLPLPLPQIQ